MRSGRAGRSRALRALLLLCVAGGLGCSTYFPVNRRLEAVDPAVGYRPRVVDQPDDSNELVLMVALSGGGLRAAAFGYGVLEELAETEVRFDGAARNLFDEIDGVTGVSGGSFTAAYLGLHDRGVFDDFEERVLRKNLQANLIFRLFWPINWLKLFSPYWARSDLAAEYYDAAIFDGATFEALENSGGPYVSIHATDLITGSPFAFTQEQFDYLCSDLSSFPVSRAVAASSAVPLLLSPITVRNYTDCGFVPPDWVSRARGQSRELDREYVNARNLHTYLDADRRYVRLVDGVISDNLGVRGPFEAWVQRSEFDATRPHGNRVRNVVLLVVNAQTTPDAEWDRAAVLPSLGFILDAATSAQVNRYNFETIELLQRTFELWNQTTTRWDPPLRFHVIETSFLDVADPEERRFANRQPTSLRLSNEAVRRLRDAARGALRSSRTFQELLAQLAVSSDTPAPPVYGPLPEPLLGLDGD
jgi:NTE family protein